MGLRRSWWLGLILVSLGLLTWTAFLYLWARTRRRRGLVWAALYFALAVATLAVLVVGGATESTAWSVIGTLLLLGLWVGALAHGLRIRREAVDQFNRASRLRQEHVPMPTASVARERGFRAAWRFYKANFWSVLALSLSFYLVIVGLAALALVELGLVVAVVTWVYLMLVSIFWLQAPLARLLEDIRAGRPKPSARRTFAELGPQLGSITGGTSVAAVAVSAGLYLFLLPGLFLLARFALLIPVIVIERRGAFRAFARSNRLVRGHTLRVMGEVVVSAILYTLVWTIALTLLGSGLTPWASLVFAVLVLALGTPVIPLMRVLSYYDLLKVAPPEPR